MTAARLRLVFLLLIGAFGLVAAAAAASLWALRDPFLAGVVALAGLFGVAAGTLTWLVARSDPEEAGLATGESVSESAPEPQLQSQPMPPLGARRPVRVQTLPVANLPPAYLAAVMKGARARTAALKEQARPRP